MVSRGSAGGKPHAQSTGDAEVVVGACRITKNPGIAASPDSERARREGKKGKNTQQGSWYRYGAGAGAGLRRGIYMMSACSACRKSVDVRASVQGGGIS